MSRRSRFFPFAVLSAAALTSSADAWARADEPLMWAPLRAMPGLAVLGTGPEVDLNSCDDESRCHEKFERCLEEGDEQECKDAYEICVAGLGGQPDAVRRLHKGRAL